MYANNVSGKALSIAIIILMLGSGLSLGAVDVITEPYLLDTGLISRSISFENPTGAPGEGGKSASRLGVGRKGSPSITLRAGQEVQHPRPAHHDHVTQLVDSQVDPIEHRDRLAQHEGEHRDDGRPQPGRHVPAPGLPTSGLHGAPSAQPG